MTAYSGRRLALRRRGGFLAAAFALSLLSAACVPTWTTFHREPGRSGADTSAPDILPVARAWTTPSLDGSIYAQPLVYNNRVYIATQTNVVYAFNLSDGSLVWVREIHDPVFDNTVPCPLNVDPMGIIGTPVIDPSSNTMFFIAELATPSVHHQLFGVDTDTGAIKVNVNADPPGVDPIMDHERPAMALSNGRLYWGYGGADCGTYHGKVVSMKTDGTSPLVYTVPSVNRGSLWAPGGPMIDPQGNVWVATGDGTSTTTYDQTTSVLKLSPTLQLLGTFAPSDWATLNAEGHEIGSTGPLLLSGGYVYQEGKNGVGYVLRQSNPGGINGQATHVNVTGCTSIGANSTSPGWIYVECTKGGPAGVQYDSSVPSVKFVWRGPSDANGSPSFGGNTLWVPGVDSGNLYALDPTTGAVRQTISIGIARNFSSPVIANDTVLVATMHTVQAFRHAP